MKFLFIGINEENRIFILQLLKESQFYIEADSTGLGVGASELLQSSDYQLVIVAASLPDGDGLSWLETNRAKGFNRPTLLLSVEENAGLAAKVLQLEATDYLWYPLLSPAVVIRSISLLLKTYQHHQDQLLAETRLALNKYRLREAQKMARLGNWELNLETNELTFSEEIFEILEMDPNQKPDYDTVLACIHPQDRAHRRLAVKKALENKTKYEVDYRILLAENRIKYTSVQGYPVVDASGKPVGLIGTLQDISDRVSARNALKESEKRYLMLLETMNEGVLHVDNDQTIIYANKSFCEIMGYEKKEVIGQTLYHFIPDGKTKELVDQKSLLRLQHISDQYEIQLLKKDGSLICFLLGGSPLRDEEGQVTGSLGTFTDISERKKIEEALKSSEKLFRTLFEDSQGFLCTHTLSGTVLSINKAGADMVGLTPLALQGMNFMEMLAPDTHASFEQYLATTRHQNHATGIFRIVNKTQDSFHDIVFRNILYQESGKDPYVIISAQDITDRISVEEELRQAKIVAENSVKIKEQFLANISHEIRTPMNGIIGLTAVLQKMVTEQEEKGYLQAIQSSADKLLIIINDILDFSKIESGKIEFEMTEFKPRRVLQESIHLFEGKAAEKNNRLKAIIDADVPDLLTGDPGKLSQILNNLLSNAIKFTQDGLIKVFLEVVSEQPDAYQLEFQVQDTGIGIQEDKIHTVFESFTQGSSDTTRKYGGTGLGLTISKQLVELQGGNISVESKPGQGSTFTFSLRFQKGNGMGSPATEAAMLPQVNPEDLGRLKVLLVEDNLINQILVRKVVKDWGFELHIAENGLEALALFKVNPYDVILMDMQMPEMDGYEATAAIRQSPGPERATPIIALTAHASQREADKCLEAGADRYVSKPFQPETLLSVIAVLLANNPVPANSSGSSRQPGTDPVARKEIINLNYLREMADGDMVFIAEIITMFIEQTPQNLHNLRAAAVAGNWKEMKALAHKMKSSVMMIGNQDLEQIFIDLQNHAVSTQPAEKIPPLIEQASDICSDAITALKAELQVLG